MSTDRWYTVKELREADPDALLRDAHAGSPAKAPTPLRSIFGAVLFTFGVTALAFSGYCASPKETGKMSLDDAMKALAHSADPETRGAATQAIAYRVIPLIDTLKKLQGDPEVGARASGLLQNIQDRIEK